MPGEHSSNGIQPINGVVVAVAIPVLLVGGTERQTLELVRTLIADKHRVVVCCYFDWSSAVVERFRRSGAEVHLLELQRPASLFGDLRAVLRLVYRLRQVIRLYRPDLVAVQYLAPGLLGVLAARLSGTRTVIGMVHQSGRPYGRTERLMLRAAASLCAAFVCVSQSAERSWFGSAASLTDYIRNGRRSSLTIYNGIDTDSVRMVARTCDVGESRRLMGIGGGALIACVARLHPLKGQATLLRALPMVAAKIPDVRLVLAGAGSDEQCLRELADSLRVAEHVTWLGEVSWERAIQTYVVADVVVVPSHAEGFGLSAAEAMAAGRAVVASAVDGLEELMDDGSTGVLVPPDDPVALAQALIQVLGDTEARMRFGMNGRQRVKERFSIATYRREIRALLSEVLRRPSLMPEEAARLS